MSEITSASDAPDQQSARAAVNFLRRPLPPPWAGPGGNAAPGAGGLRGRRRPDPRWPDRLRRPRHRRGVAGAPGRLQRQARGHGRHLRRPAATLAWTRCSKTTRSLKEVDVKPDYRFVGFDAYKKVLACGVDVVLLTTPPHFRPLHLKAAVEAGKHIFSEKPMAVDAPGVRSVLDSCDGEEEEPGLVAGFCYRYDLGFREIVRRLHDGAVGRSSPCNAPTTPRIDWSKARQPGWDDMQYQLRNWHNFTWLSGDHIVEQHVHFLDKMAWAMKDTVSRSGRWARAAGRRGPARSSATSSTITPSSSSTPTAPSCTASAGSRRAAETTSSITS